MSNIINDKREKQIHFDLKSDIGLLFKYNEIWKHGCSNHLTRKQQQWQNKTEQDLSIWDVRSRDVANSGQVSRNLPPPTSGILLILQGFYLNMDIARSFELL
jgi:hypothetical protein